MNASVLAAQYLRMSTEHQQYSTENQAAAIAEYAATHGFVIARTYSDPARSGLWLRNRPGLRDLLRDVSAGQTPYRAILVYDVSRWGRFQDTDESAHYEFLCKSAGIPVHYCAEVFPNDGSSFASMVKSLRRIMASDYSRDLGTKVLAGQRRLAELGFKMGGTAPYGFRRMLVSAERKPKQVLEFGERKSIATDRVVFVLGPEREVECVRRIFRLFTTKQMTIRGIAHRLNREKVPYQRNEEWTRYVVARMLSNPNYVGCNVFSRSTMRLGTPRIERPRAEWIVIPNAHPTIVDEATFREAQKTFDGLTIRKTNDQILGELKELLASRGRISTKIIAKTPGMASPSTLRLRFGSMHQTYKLIGHVAHCGSRPWTWMFREELMSRIQTMFPNEVSIIAGGRWRSRLKLRNGLMVSVLIAPCLREGRIWRVDAGKREHRSITLVARLNIRNRDFRDFLVFPRLPSPGTIYLNPNDDRLRSATKLEELSQLCDVVRELHGRSVPNHRQPCRKIGVSKNLR
jgi:DNA invertase Pin-like site-specific DNA recombinase